MKNIFLIPTDKPSRLLKQNNNKLILSKQIVYSHISKHLNNINQNIYITNNEEIEPGDWFIHYSHGTTSLLKAIEVGNRILDNQGTSCNIDYCKKVVLTNDPTLIEDGVQEVSSSFLSFYVENPVDYVEVIKGFADGTSYGYNFLDYSLNFPQKEEWLFERSSGYAGYRNTETNEWIYEEDYFKLFSTEEKLYTKEDLEIAHQMGANFAYGRKEATRIDRLEHFNNWLKNYKK